MTKQEADAAKNDLIKAGWPIARIERAANGGWKAVGEDYSLRPAQWIKPLGGRR